MSEEAGRSSSIIVGSLIEQGQRSADSEGQNRGEDVPYYEDAHAKTDDCRVATARLLLLRSDKAGKRRGSKHRAVIDSRSCSLFVGHLPCMQMAVRQDRQAVVTVLDDTGGR